MQATRRPEWVGDVGVRTTSCSADQIRSGPRCFLPVTIIYQQGHSECKAKLMDGPKRYYVIDTPGQGLTVHTPVGKADEVGVRPAISQSRFPRVRGMLRSRPHLLPADYRERQEQVCAQLKTGRMILEALSLDPVPAPTIVPAGHLRLPFPPGSRAARRLRRAWTVVPTLSPQSVECLTG